MEPTERVFHTILISLLCVKGVSSAIDICNSGLCECFEDIADCHGRNLSSVDETLTIPKNVAKVDLSNNMLTILENLDFEVAPHLLECLDLSSNALAELSTQSFRAFNESVKTLYLKNNLIQLLHEETFVNLKSLTKLDLSFNRISTLPDGFFDGLVHLEILDLSFNPIQDLKETTFMGLRDLKMLNLSFLQLSLIHPEIFDWNLTITHLDLAYNYFTSIPSKALWYLRDTLQTLELSGNLFQTIPEGSFFELRRLEALYMEQLLELRRIEVHAFGDLENLETLVLRYLPKIKEIHSQAFQLSEHGNETSIKLCPLRDFTVQFSTLSYLPETLLHWDQLRYADLKNNRWMCDCNLKWIKGSALEELAGSMFYCWGPLKYRGRNIHSLEKENFTCNLMTVDTQSGVIAILVIVVLALVISFLTVILLTYRRNGWVVNPPRLHYDKVDSPFNSITIFDRASSASTTTDREMVSIHY